MVDDHEVMNRAEALLRQFARKLDFTGDLALLREALTHSSYANEVGQAPYNERLEFLGDSVLSLLVSQGLYRAHPEQPEGILSRWRSAIVNASSLAEQAQAMGLGELMWLGKGEERTGGRSRPSVLANAFEAVLGALFLAHELPAAERLVERCFGDRIRQGAPGPVYRDYKTRLQETAQRLLTSQPEYQLIKTSGPDHQRVFEMAVRLRGEEYGRGVESSKKRAENLAAEQALERLEREEREGRWAPA